MNRAFVVAGARLTHRRASLDELEAAAHADPGARLEELLDRDAVAEAFVLQTCNRVEEYVVAGTAEAGREALADFAPGVEGAVETDHGESLRHLLRVAAGLESQVLGEDQILGQFREAFLDAQDAGAVGPVLEEGLLKAIHVGERARTETDINEGIVSLGSAAVDLAARERGLGTVVVVGAGEGAHTVVGALAERDAGELRILNRSPEGARALAEEHGVDAETGPIDDLPGALDDADVAISATGSDEPVIDVGVAAGADDLFLLDLGQPRDVAPGVVGIDGVAVRDLDALQAVTEATHERRREAAVEVEAIVDEAFDELIEQYKRKRADAVIAGMYRGAERIKQRELREALAKLEADGLTDEQAEVVEEMAGALVSQLLAVPTESLRDAAAEDDWETVATAIELFDPGLGGDGPALFEAMAAGDGTPEPIREED